MNIKVILGALLFIAAIVLIILSAAKVLNFDVTTDDLVAAIAAFIGAVYAVGNRTKVE